MGRERESEADKVERLTTMAESGDKKGLMEELHAMDPFERAGIARQMDELNAQRRTENSKLPDIEITTSRDLAGMERLEDIISKVPNDAKAWYKPWTWFSSSEIKTDVYDKEQGADVGNLREVFSHRNRQLNEMIGSNR
jgi:hypothetical protein